MRRAGIGMALATLVAASSADALEPPTPTANVHVTSPRPVTVFYAAAGKQNWNRLCETPCSTEIQLPADLRIESKVITVDKPGPVDISVDPPNKTLMTTGLIVGGVGALSVLAGGAYFLLSLVAGSVGGGDCSKYPVNPVFGTSRADCEHDNETTDTMRTIGLVLMGAGVVPLGVGAALYIPSSRTSVDQKSAPPPQARLPAWRELPTAPRGSASAAQFPLVWTMHF